MLKEFLSQLKPKETLTELRFGPAAIDVKTKDLKNILFPCSIKNNEYNLILAEKNGVKPLTLGEIINQINPEHLSQTVLFDTPPKRGFAGNHWRILEIDQEQNFGTLQFCGPFGNYDYDLIPSFNISFDTPLFTGVSLQKYEIDESPVSLQEVVKTIQELGKPDYYPECLKRVDENILWSNSQGELVGRDNHDAFKN